MGFNKNNQKVKLCVEGGTSESEGSKEICPYNFPRYKERHLCQQVSNHFSRLIHLEV